MATIRGTGVVVKGLDEFRRAVRDLDLADDLKDVNYAVAQLVVRESQSDAARLGRMEGKAAATLRAGRQAARAVVTGGGARVPYFWGSAFGAGRNQPRRAGTRNITGWNQFLPWRGSGPGAGYFPYPAIERTTDQIIEMYGDGLMKVAAKAFPE